MIATKFYLDTRKTKEGRPAPLMISISYKRETAYINTGIKILPDQWNPEGVQAKSRTVQRNADDVMYNVNTLISELTKKGKLDGLSAREIRDTVRRELSPKDIKPIRLLQAIEEYAMTRRKQRTTEIYMATAARIRAFDDHADELSMEHIGVGWLDRFDSFLALTSPKKNARNIHLRNIRSVMRLAFKRKQTTNYPFSDYKVRPEPTKKRDLCVEDLRILFNANVKDWQQKYVDFFKISFMLIGINTEDLLHATRIEGGRLVYQRAKTNKPYSIKVEPECMELIRKYRGKKYLLNILDTYSKTNHWTSKVNNELQAIAAQLGLPKISMYWTRHTWSTISANIDIPKETTAVALGHGSKTVTDIYIDFDQVKVDRANRKVLDYVLYDKKEADIYDMIRQLNEKISMNA